MWVIIEQILWLSGDEREGDKVIKSQGDILHRTEVEVSDRSAVTFHVSCSSFLLYCIVKVYRFVLV